MAEDTIWKGTSSQWENFKPFAFFVISIPASIGLHHWLGDKGVGVWIYALILLAGLWAFSRWLILKTTVYHLTSERLITSHGILTKVTDTLELYRVRDLQMVQPLFLRILGLQNIHIITTDSTSAELILDYMPTSANLGDQLRNCVEACRKAKRVSAMDVVSESPGDHQEGHPTAS